MSLVIDLFFSFRSPYSYLVTPAALEIKTNYDVDIQLRPVLPLAVRQRDFFDPDNLKRGIYILKDWPRRAEMMGLPHAWPKPDPIVTDLETFQATEEQPYIYRLVHLGVEANRRGRGLEYAAEVSRVIFGGTENWDQGDHLAKAAERAGLNLASMDAAIEESPQSYQQEVELNQTNLEICGHWGVPTFGINGEPFFGHDRIDSVCFELDKLGLRRT
ncbi:2-hydroxychromene-2-carboxylate isomerase [Pseudoteredinibacter isoporae]|uniref:2-hydroxychromene-2-carboxylate isomerase n=1 Tax=Pseudoteredinibacter isoporae TaxID=570281 RepID=A0A7X0JRC4_9GAMM|nr:DsbA family protein [Pseudoteredinibacter isoporae]MBB6520869.1 2-hydroxychromene-2-carboxylate isomerase [Pseudoteredinibacter isoporae]NHO86434.1 2-hydroxychromene-2-carboxylate isomerase [Pseudoteredinibacter isoporae]NIB25114.1 2-hydroxychromene-2-carboxylate isomerase [Pseudoteredinibacter isoporae]